MGGEARLIARDDRKNPLISTFDWTSEAVPRILRVPAGFMRNQTQERIEALARERGVVTIDLALVEEGIEIGKRMMAEMIATYPTKGKSTAETPVAVPAVSSRRRGGSSTDATPAPPRMLRPEAAISTKCDRCRRVRARVDRFKEEVPTACRRTGSAARTMWRFSSRR